MEQEEERKRIMEEADEDQETLAFDTESGNLNSKKSLQTALKDKRPIASITRLRAVMNFAIISLLALAAADYSVISNSFGEVNENFNLIQKSFGRLSEFERVAFNIRALIMTNEKILNVT